MVSPIALRDVLPWTERNESGVPDRQATNYGPAWTAELIAVWVLGAVSGVIATAVAVWLWSLL
jgi:hypothetical protein